MAHGMLASVSDASSALAPGRVGLVLPPVEGGGVDLAEPLLPFGIELQPGLAQQHVREQAAAHADASVDAPDREGDPLRLERLAPGEHVLVDAIDERAVEVEENAARGRAWTRPGRSAAA